MARGASSGAAGIATFAIGLAAAAANRSGAADGPTFAIGLAKSTSAGHDFPVSQDLLQ
jgi:hypothetical protein